ncbi:glycosyltransferase family 4 protein [Blastopirellula marina]|uniref:Mannosyltransferase n=1 Tax=Blastopirellula marina DSM 3645 TaxID=314230 RepID=A3ZP88_9BACT|nr:glycosyltransferase family 1 protein [Blastopirellula marina]EAQ81566.1 mannosyltransferase [Blastopirellula marina DSM 3645]
MKIESTTAPIEAGPLRVGFNANLLSDPAMRGWNRYAVNLLEHLPSANVQLVLYSMEPIAGQFLARFRDDSCVQSVSRKMNYTKWEQWWLPRQLRRDGIEVFHSPYHFGIPFATKCPCVVTLHDAIGQQRWPQFNGWRHAMQIGNWANYGSHVVARRKSTKVITVSRFSQSELVRRLSVDAQRISIIPEAADPIFATFPAEEKIQETAARFQLAKPYLFYIGGFEGRKNLDFLLKAFAAANLKDVVLALAGGDDDNRDRLRRLAAELEILDNVRFLGRVDDDDLPSLYRHAMAFVYPSLEEGFGLQLCEAMAMGCPILAANATSLPEVLGDGGALFNPTSVDDLTSLLRKIAEDPLLRHSLSQCSLHRGKQFSWQETARLTRVVYESIAPRMGAIR